MPLPENIHQPPFYIPQKKLLDLSSCTINDSDISLLKKFLISCPGITRLHLNSQQLTREGLEAVIALPHIQEFDISGNKISTYDANKHLLVVGNTTYTIISKKEFTAKNFFKQTGMSEKRDAFGKGACGSVDLVKSEDGQFFALKKYNDPSYLIMLLTQPKAFIELANQYTKDIEKYPGALRSFDYFFSKEDGRITMYSIMPIANFGTLRQLLFFLHGHTFNETFFKNLLKEINKYYDELVKNSIIHAVTNTFDTKAKVHIIIIIHVLKKLLLTLQAMHKDNFYHRDLKTDNILLDTNGNPLLTDFNCSCKSGHQAHLNWTLLPPELKGGSWEMENLNRYKEDCVNQTIDSWQLGLLLLSMLNRSQNIFNRLCRYTFSETSLDTDRRDFFACLQNVISQNHLPIFLRRIIIELLHLDEAKRFKVDDVIKAVNTIPEIKPELIQQIFSVFYRIERNSQDVAVTLSKRALSNRLPAPVEHRKRLMPSGINLPTNYFIWTKLPEGEDYSLSSPSNTGF